MQTLCNIINWSIASQEGKALLQKINLQINAGEIHVLMGQNGAGKSTLATSILNSANYKKTAGQIIFDGEDISELPTNKRAEKGIFLSFQAPISITGISLNSFLKAIARHSACPLVGRALKRKIAEIMELLNIPANALDRDFNVGFSGGERKKIEMLQLLLVNPKLAILDEADSGLDVDAIRILSKAIQAFRQDKSKSLLLISHNMTLLNQLPVDKVHILKQGQIIKTGGEELIKQISTQGFSTLEQEA